MFLQSQILKKALFLVGSTLIKKKYTGVEALLIEYGLESQAKLVRKNRVILEFCRQTKE